MRTICPTLATTAGRAPVLRQCFNNPKSVTDVDGIIVNTIIDNGARPRAANSRITYDMSRDVLSGAQEATIMVRYVVGATNNASGKHILCKFPSSGADNAWFMQFSSNRRPSLYIAASPSDSSNYGLYGTSLDPGPYTFHWVYNGKLAAGSRLRLYIDGLEVPLGISGTIPARMRAATNVPVTALNWNGGSSQAPDTDDALLEFAIYPYAMSASEVLADYSPRPNVYTEFPVDLSWTPESAYGANLWSEYRSDTTISVSSWTRRVGSANYPFLQANGLLQPTLVAGATPSGQPALRFNGIDQYMQTAAAVINQPTYVLIAANWTFGGFKYLLDGRTTSNALIYQAVAGTASAFAGTQLIGPSGVTGAWKAFTYGLNSTTSFIGNNGGALVWGNAGSAAANGFTLGAGGTPISNWSAADVSMICIVDRMPTREELYQHVAYAKRWNGIP